MRHCRYHEAEAQEQYLDRLKKKYSDASMIITGLRINLEVMRNLYAYINTGMPLQ